MGTVKDQMKKVAEKLSGKSKKGKDAPSDFAEALEKADGYLTELVKEKETSGETGKLEVLRSMEFHLGQIVSLAEDYE